MLSIVPILGLEVSDATTSMGCPTGSGVGVWADSGFEPVSSGFVSAAGAVICWEGDLENNPPVLDEVPGDVDEAAGLPFEAGPPNTGAPLPANGEVEAAPENGEGAGVPPNKAKNK